MRVRGILAAAVMIAATMPAIADVGTGYTLFGDAAYVSPGNASNRAVKLEADVIGEFGGIDFGVPPALAIEDLTLLSTDYFFPSGASCGGGAPRFQIQLDAFPDKNIFVYIGPPPNFVGCTSNVWQNTGNLLTDASLVDTSQLPSGSQTDTWGAAKLRYAGAIVTDIVLVTDTFDTSSNTVIVDNTQINETVYDYEFETAADCKKGGWKLFVTDPGPFKNQGQCVSFFKTTAADCKKGGWKLFVTDPGPFKNQGQCVSFFNRTKS